MAHQTKIGKHLIEMLMFNLYADNRVIYREYVQNASDSIHLAIKQGILTPEDAHITVHIEMGKISIEDNGTGISINDSERILKDIANSQKDDNQAGRFGIGRLSGGGYCRTLIFETSLKGEDKKSILHFNVDNIRQIINDPDNQPSASEIIDENTTFRVENEDADLHYFKVTLKGILPEYANIICNEQLVTDYLREVAPIKFEASFKHNILDCEIDNDENADVRDYYNNLDCITLTVNNKLDIRKPYKSKIQSAKNDKIEHVRFFVIKDAQYGDLAWGWAGITPFSEVIKEPDDNAVVGFRLRLHNILIGTKNHFDEQRVFKQARSNKYFVGEVHIVNKNIKPTPQRDDLAPSKETISFYEGIRKLFCDEFERIYQSANNLKVALNKFNEGKISIDEIREEYSKKNNNQFKNLLGYKYLLDIYNPKFEEIFAKNAPKSEQPQTVVPATSQSMQTVPPQSTVSQPTTDSSSNKSPQTDLDAMPQSTVTAAHEPTQQPQTEMSQLELPLEPSKPADKKLEKLENRIGVSKTAVVEEILEIIDKNFQSNKKKETVANTAKKIKAIILRELGRKK